MHNEIYFVYQKSLNPKKIFACTQTQINSAVKSHPTTRNYYSQKASQTSAKPNPKSKLLFRFTFKLTVPFLQNGNPYGTLHYNQVLLSIFFLSLSILFPSLYLSFIYLLSIYLYIYLMFLFLSFNKQVLLLIYLSISMCLFIYNLLSNRNTHNILL